MPTYDYQCEKCGYRFEQFQKMSDAPVKICPECQGSVRRLLSGGAGFFLKGSDNSPVGHRGSECSLEQTGKTCCGLDERCGKPPCESER